MNAPVKMSFAAAAAKTATRTAALQAEMEEAKKLAESAPGAKPKAKGKTMELERFGLFTEAQWLLTSPSRFEDYKTYTDDFNALYQGTTAMVRGTVSYKQLYDDRGAKTDKPQRAVRVFAFIRNARGQSVSVTAFGKPGFAWKGYEKGSQIVVRGVAKLNDRNEMGIDQVEVVKPAQLGRIIPVYPAIRGTKGERFAEKIQEYMHLIDTAAALLEGETGWNDKKNEGLIGEVTQFPGAKKLLEEMHRPTSIDAAKKAVTAARFLSSWSLIRKTAQRVDAIEMNPRSIINIDTDYVRELKSRMPYDLTHDQRAAIDGICASLRGPRPMTGLLTGDVGSGKTLSFLIPMVAAYKAKKKVVLMTPNLLLIRQIGIDMQTYFPEVPVISITGKGGKAAFAGDVDGSVLVGNTALIAAMHKGKLGRKPDFLVVDEQHKFSVAQRESMIETWTNSLEATATPIPRTAALAIHGARDLFLIQQIPVHKEITSRIMLRDEAKEARNTILRAVLTRGEQAAVIYPLVSSDDLEKAALTVTSALEKWSGMVPVEQIAVLHGKMKDEEKDAVIASFRSGEKKLLLASTVVEVGITLPELKTMLVIGADNLGVVTLHQLRGRLARHGGAGEFMMFTETDSPESLERLELVAQYQDGFVLAEKDAEQRGYGDILGLDNDAQSGRTRTLFLGVNIGPVQISFAANAFENTAKAERAALAAGVAGAMAVVRKGEAMKL